MEAFRIVQPMPALRPYVKHYWILKTAANAASRERIIPTGMMGLIFHRSGSGTGFGGNFAKG